MFCEACWSGLHEIRNCRYLDAARDLRNAGIDVLPRELRAMEEAV